MATRVRLYRHAEATKNSERIKNIVAGRSLHSPLTTKGREQSAQLGEYFKHQQLEFGTAISSPANRAYGTGLIALRTAGLVRVELDVAPELLEISQGSWEGQDRTRPLSIDGIIVEQTYPHPRDRGLDGRVHGGESVREVGTRILGKCVELGRQYPDADVALFTHDIALRCALVVLTNDFDDNIGRRIGHCSETLFTYDPAQDSLQVQHIGLPTSI
jgi:broad specificity phosphatase PhoE